MNPQLAFVEVLLAAMKDAVVEGELTQLAIQFDPTEGKGGPLKKVRIIVVPEKMQHEWPTYAPLGSVQGKG